MAKMPFTMAGDAVVTAVADHPQAIVRLQTRGEAPLTPAERRAVVREQLTVAPSKFLHRWGTHLGNGELTYFDGLPDTDVRYHARQLRVTLERRQHTVRNRRLRYLEKLGETETEQYFGLPAMQQRCPLLYEEYIGQYELEGPDQAVPSTWSEELMQVMANTTLRNRLAAEQRACRRAEADFAHSMGNVFAEEEKEELREDDEGDMQSSDEEEVQPGWAPHVPLPISDTEREQLGTDFERLMRERFLDGLDADFFDYSMVDDNPEYDDLAIRGMSERSKEERGLI